MIDWSTFKQKLTLHFSPCRCNEKNEHTLKIPLSKRWLTIRLLMKALLTFQRFSLFSLCCGNPDIYIQFMKCGALAINWAVWQLAIGVVRHDQTSSSSIENTGAGFKWPRPMYGDQWIALMMINLAAVTTRHPAANSAFNWNFQYSETRLGNWFN